MWVFDINLKDIGQTGQIYFIKGNRLFERSFELVTLLVGLKLVLG